MDKANYLVFHPENSRQQINVIALAMVYGQIIDNWTGEIFVDKIFIGNEDPFVFYEPWIYSFCHASQLRKKFRKDNNYLQAGSKIFFISGEYANKGILTIDTVFIIEGVQKWNEEKSLHLPSKYQPHYQNENSDLWKRHLAFPFKGIHDKVSHTYESQLWNNDRSQYSFLPLDKIGNRVSISFEELSSNLKTKILAKVKGKYPVLLTDDEINALQALIDERVMTKVLKGIHLYESIY